jgi:hypothetical protein
MTIKCILAIALITPVLTESTMPGGDQCWLLGP